MNKKLGKVVLATSDLVAELVARNVFTKDQVLDKAINAESLKISVGHIYLRPRTV